MKSQQAEDRSDALIAMGKQIRKVRETRFKSQEGFAAVAGVGRSYYGGVERGQRNVSALNLMVIAANLNVEVGELFPPRATFGPLLRNAVQGEAI